MATVILFIHGWLESCSFQYVFFFASFFLSIDYCSVLLQWRKPIHVLICILACRFCFQTFPLYTCFDQKRRKKKREEREKEKTRIAFAHIYIFGERVETERHLYPIPSLSTCNIRTETSCKWNSQLYSFLYGKRHF